MTSEGTVSGLNDRMDLLFLIVCARLSFCCNCSVFGMPIHLPIQMKMIIIYNITDTTGFCKPLRKLKIDCFGIHGRSRHLDVHLSVFLRDPDFHFSVFPDFLALFNREAFGFGASVLPHIGCHDA